MNTRDFCLLRRPSEVHGRAPDGHQVHASIIQVHYMQPPRAFDTTTSCAICTLKKTPAKMRPMNPRPTDGCSCDVDLNAGMQPARLPAEKQRRRLLSVQLKHLLSQISSAKRVCSHALRYSLLLSMAANAALTGDGM
jgi:hypothetical protein